MTRSKIQRFSLTELLVMIAILVILLSMLQPALSKMVEHSVKLNCMNTLRQLSAISTIYEDENDGIIPRSVTTISGPYKSTKWPSLFKQGGYPEPADGLLRCPNIKKGGWGMTYGMFSPANVWPTTKDNGNISMILGNYTLSGFKPDLLLNPSEFPMFTDTAGGWVTAGVSNAIQNGIGKSAGHFFGANNVVNAGGCVYSMWFSHRDSASLALADGHVEQATIDVLLGLSNYNPNATVGYHGISYYWDYFGLVATLH